RLRERLHREDAPGRDLPRAQGVRRRAEAASGSRAVRVALAAASAPAALLPSERAPGGPPRPGRVPALLHRREAATVLPLRGDRGLSPAARLRALRVARRGAGPGGEPERGALLAHHRGRAVRRIAAATALAFLLSGAVAAGASGATAARLRGTFTMQGRITVADNVRGEHAGQRVRRTWTFYPQCKHGACRQVVLKRRRSARGLVDTLTLNRQSPGVYSRWGHFWMALKCNGRVVYHTAVAAERITVHITRAVREGGTRYATGIRASYYNPYRHQYTRCPGSIGHDSAVYTGHLAVRAI